MVSTTGTYIFNMKTKQTKIVKFSKIIKNSEIKNKIN